MSSCGLYIITGYMSQFEEPRNAEQVFDTPRSVIYVEWIWSRKAAEFEGTGHLERWVYSIFFYRVDVL